MRALACSAACARRLQRAFGRLRLPEVAHGGAVARRRPGVGETRQRHRQRQRLAAPVAAGELLAAARRRLFAPRALEARRRVALALRREQGEEAFARHFLDVVAEQRLGAAAHRQHAARIVERDDAVGGGVEQRLEVARLALETALPLLVFDFVRAAQRQQGRRRAVPFDRLGQRVDRDQFAAGRDQRNGAALVRFGERLSVAAAEHAVKPVGGAELGEIAVAGEIEQRAVEVERLAAAQHHCADRQLVDQRFGVGAAGAGRRLSPARRRATARGRSDRAARRLRRGSAERAPSARAISRNASRSWLESSTLSSPAAPRLLGGRRRRRRARADRHDIGRGAAGAQHDDFGAAFGRRGRAGRRRGSAGGGGTSAAAAVRRAAIRSAAASAPAARRRLVRRTARNRASRRSGGRDRTPARPTSARRARRPLRPSSSAARRRCWRAASASASLRSRSKPTRARNAASVSPVSRSRVAEGGGERRVDGDEPLLAVEAPEETMRRRRARRRPAAARRARARRSERRRAPAASARTSRSPIRPHNSANGSGRRPSQKRSDSTRGGPAVAASTRLATRRAPGLAAEKSCASSAARSGAPNSVSAAGLAKTKPRRPAGGDDRRRAARQSLGERRPRQQGGGLLGGDHGSVGVHRRRSGSGRGAP